MNQILKIAKHNIRMFFLRPWGILILFVPILLSVFTQFLFNDGQVMAIGAIGIYVEDTSDVTQLIEEKLIAAQVNITHYKDKGKLEDAVRLNNIDLGIIMAYDNSYEALKKDSMPYEFVRLEEDQVSGKIETLKEVFTTQVNYFNQLIKASQSEDGFYRLYEEVKQSEPKIHVLNDIKTMMTMKISFSFFVMMFLITVGISLSPMMREREYYVYERIVVAPLKKYQYILGHLVGAFIIVFTQIIIQFCGMKWIKVDFNLDGFKFLIIGVVLCIVGISISLLILAISKKSMTYYLIMGIGLTPLCMLSNLFLPIELLPTWIQNISYLSPIRWIVKGYEDMVYNRPIQDMLGGLGIAVLIATVLILVSLILTSSYQEQE